MGQTGVITDFVFLAFIRFIFLLEVLNILGSHRKPYAGNLESRSDLPPVPPWVKLGHKSADLVFLAVITS